MEKVEMNVYAFDELPDKRKTEATFLAEKVVYKIRDNISKALISKYHTKCKEIGLECIRIIINGSDNVTILFDGLSDKALKKYFGKKTDIPYIAKNDNGISISDSELLYSEKNYMMAFSEIGRIMHKIMLLEDELSKEFQTYFIKYTSGENTVYDTIRFIIVNDTLTLYSKVPNFRINKNILEKL